MLNECDLLSVASASHMLITLGRGLNVVMSQVKLVGGMSGIVTFLCIIGSNTQKE